MRKSEIRIIPKLCPPTSESGGGHVPPGPMVAPPMVGHPMTKMLSASGGLRPPRPPDQGLCPWAPLRALPPDPRYRLVLCTRHGAPPTPSAAYDPRASSPPAYFYKFTPMQSSTMERPSTRTTEARTDL